MSSILEQIGEIPEIVIDHYDIWKSYEKWVKTSNGYGIDLEIFVKHNEVYKVNIPYVWRPGLHGMTEGEMKINEINAENYLLLQKVIEQKIKLII